MRTYIIGGLVGILIVLTAVLVLTRDRTATLSEAEIQQLIIDALITRDASALAQVPPGTYGDFELVEQRQANGTVAKVLIDKRSRQTAMSIGASAREPESTNRGPVSRAARRPAGPASAVAEAQSAGSQSNLGEAATVVAAAPDTLADEEVLADNETGQAVDEDTLPVIEGIDDEVQQQLVRNAGRSNDIVLNLEGRTINFDEIEALNTNSGAVWLMGLTGKQYELMADYGDRLLEIPGVGYYLLPKPPAGAPASFYDQKATILEAALRASPGSAGIAHALAQSYVNDKGDLDRALALIDTMEQRSAPGYNGAFERAEAYRAASLKGSYTQRRGQLQTAALDDYHKTIYSGDATYKQIGAAAVNSYDLYEKRGQTAEGVALLEDVYGSYGRNLDWYEARNICLTLGSHYAKAGDPRAALQWYDQYDGKDWGLEVRKAESYEVLGDHRRALEAYRESWRLNKSPDTQLRVIDLCLKQGWQRDAQDAMGELDRVLQGLSGPSRQRVRDSGEYKRLQKQLAQ